MTKKNQKHEHKQENQQPTQQPATPTKPVELTDEQLEQVVGAGIIIYGNPSPDQVSLNYKNFTPTAVE
jgi:hypothetical protein